MGLSFFFCPWRSKEDVTWSFPNHKAAASDERVEKVYRVVTFGDRFSLGFGAGFSANFSRRTRALVLCFPPAKLCKH